MISYIKSFFTKDKRKKVDVVGSLDYSDKDSIYFEKEMKEFISSDIWNNNTIDSIISFTQYGTKRDNMCDLVEFKCDPSDILEEEKSIDSKLLLEEQIDSIIEQVYIKRISLISDKLKNIIYELVSKHNNLDAKMIELQKNYVKNNKTINNIVE